MEYIKILNGVKCPQIIFTVFSCGIHAYLWKAVQSGDLRLLINLSIASLSFPVLEEFHLPQPLFRLRFRLVRAAEIFPLFGENFITFFHFSYHCRLLHDDGQTKAQPQSKRNCISARATES
jgi:hypothetical protein